MNNKLTFVSKIQWLVDTLNQHGFDGVHNPEYRIWPQARNGECYANVAAFVALHPRFEAINGYMINFYETGEFDFVMSGHAVVRDRETDKLFHLTAEHTCAGKKGLFAEDNFISFSMHQAIMTAGDALQELLVKHVSEPKIVKMVEAMPFGRDHTAERDTLGLLTNPELSIQDKRGQTGRVRRWEIARSGDLGNGTTANVGFSVFYDDLKNGVIVGLPRLLVVAAVV